MMPWKPETGLQETVASANGYWNSGAKWLACRGRFFSNFSVYQPENTHIKIIYPAAPGSGQLWDHRSSVLNFGISFISILKVAVCNDTSVGWLWIQNFLCKDFTKDCLAQQLFVHLHSKKYSLCLSVELNKKPLFC